MRYISPRVPSSVLIDVSTSRPERGQRYFNARNNSGTVISLTAFHARLFAAGAFQGHVGRDFIHKGMSEPAMRQAKIKNPAWRRGGSRGEAAKRDKFCVADDVRHATRERADARHVPGSNEFWAFSTNAVAAYRTKSRPLCGPFRSRGTFDDPAGLHRPSLRNTTGPWGTGIVANPYAAHRQQS